MNKTELINAIAQGAALKKDDAKNAVEVAIETIGKALKEGDKVSILGFGTFEVAIRPAHEGVNPSNGQKIQIAEKKVVKFKAGAALAEAVK